MAICKKCSKEFMAFGCMRLCKSCHMEQYKPTLLEKMEKAREWFEERGVEVLWLKDRPNVRRKGYDGLAEVPDVGMVRVSLGNLKKRSEMSLAVADALVGGGEVRVGFSCARTTKGLLRRWDARKKLLKRDHMWPGRCGCMGCLAKRWFDEKTVR